MAHCLFRKFGKQLEQLYGKEFITPNNHLHMHLRDCVIDFGPVYSYWLFAFERFNYNVSNLCTNKRNIEVQIMRNATRQTYLKSLEKDVDVDLKPVFFKEKNPSEICKMPYELSNVALSGQVFCEGQWSKLDSITLTDVKKVSVLDDDEVEHLRECYQKMYKQTSIVPQLVRQCMRYDQVKVGSEKYLSSMYGSKNRHGRVMASWCCQTGQIDFDAEVRPCKIKYFLRHSIEMPGCKGTKYVPHVFAVVQWYKKYPGENTYLNPVSVWEEKRFELPGSVSYIPVQRIHCRFAWASHPGGRLIVSPIPARVAI